MFEVRRLWLVALLVCTGCGKSVQERLQPTLSDPVAPVTSADGQIWYLLAVSATLRGDREEAERAWGWAVRLQPDDPDLLARFGDHLADERRYDEARETWLHALRLDARQPLANLGLGLLHLRVGERSLALPYLVRAAEGGSVDGSVAAIHTLLQLDRSEQAAQELDAWLARPVTQAGELERRGMAARDVGRSDLAVDLLVDSLEREQPGVGAGTLMVGAARSSCRIGTAWRWAVRNQVGLREDESWRMVAVEIGVSARDAGLVEESLRGDEGLSGDLLLHRITLLRDAGRSAEALEVVDRALMLAPGSGQVRLARARLLLALGRVAQAEQGLRDLVGDPEVSPRALSMLTDLLLERGEVDQALALFEDPLGDARVAFARALSYRSLPAAEAVWLAAEVAPAERARRVGALRALHGDLVGARQALEQAQGALVLLERARLESALGPPETARAAWQAVVEQDPASVEGWLALATLQPDQADTHLRAALQADPCEPRVLVALAHQSLGCAALPWVERALEAAPTDPSVLGEATSAYDGCAREDFARAREGLLVVEQSWRALGVDEQADALAALRITLESE